MARIVVIGGGLAGLAAAAALGGDGHQVEVVEARGFAGGRATSYPVAGVTGTEEEIDNCQHILLRCCVNLLDFYRRLGAEEAIEFHREFYFIEPGGRVSVMKRGRLPAPLHFTGSFAGLRFLSLKDKAAIARALLAIRTERHRGDLDSISMLDWLKQKRQTPQAIERFWRQILVSAVNEELDIMAASHGFKVFWLGFLAASDSYEMGIPSVRLGELYSERRWAPMPGVKFRFRTPATAIHHEGNRIATVESSEGPITGDHYISALPPDRLALLMPGLALNAEVFGASPITGIHLWFDRKVTDLPHATTLDRTIQWFFNKDGGRYLQLVVSASRGLSPLGRKEIIDLALSELSEFLPEARRAKLVKAHVVKEMKATFSARTGLEEYRPGPGTEFTNLSLAGDWTKSGWPATMEGAVRSGYIAAGHASAALGRARNFVIDDIA